MTASGRRNANERLIAAFAGGSKVEDAAREAGVSESTAYRRLRDADFKKRVADARAAMVSRVVGQLADASTTAAATLRRLLNADSENVRLGAARAILELGSKLREGEELEQRIAALEEAMEHEAAKKAGR